jgi:hypothetical protein
MAPAQRALVGLALEDKAQDPKEERPAENVEMDWR